MGIPMINYPVFRPYTNITPFTVRDGATYLLQIETLLGWIRNDLVPHIDKEIKELAENWDSTAVELISTWEQMSADLIARVELAEANLGTAVTDAEAAKVAAEAARDLAAMYASTVETIQDTAITNIFSDGASEFRQTVNLVLADMIVEDLNDEGTFIVNVNPPVEPFNVSPDPNDPGFWKQE